jgi:hypothetical protein
MAGIGDLRGRVIITNAASGTLNQVKRDLASVGAMSGRTTLGQFSGNALASSVLATNRLQQAIVGLRAALVGSGFAMAGIVQSTKQFSESNFGYGFARISEFIKNGKLDIDAWRGALRDAANEARTLGKSYGATPEAAMGVMEETEKLGFSGYESKAIRNNALALYQSEPEKLDPGAAAQYLGAVYRAYNKQIEKAAAAAGVNPADDKAMQPWREKFIRDMASKSSLAAGKSALGPADTIEGMRQYAPQWAAMGVPLEFSLAALAHGSNFGYRAPELGTAYKSLVNRTLNPSATGLRLLNNLGVDRSKFMTGGAADPQNAVRRLNSLVDGQLFAGKGGKEARARWTNELRNAYDSGTMTSPEFQEKLTQMALKRLGKGWEGRADDVRQAVANATVVPNGGLDLPGYLKELRDKGASISDIAQIFEGRHIARNTPLFEEYDKMISMYETLQRTDGTMLDAVVEGRKQSDAGQNTGVYAAFQDLMTKLRESGPIRLMLDTVTSLLQQASNSSVAVGGLAVAIAGLAAAGGAAAVVSSVTALARFFGTGGAIAAGTAAAAGTAGLAAGTGAAAAGGAGALAAAKAAARMGLRFIPGIGLVVMGVGAGYGAYSAWAGGGSAGDVAAGATNGAVGLDVLPVGSGKTPPTLPPGARYQPDGGPSQFDQPGAGGGLGDGIAGGAQSAVAQAQSAADQIRAIFASINLAAEGQQMMNSLADGIMAGGAAAVSAANTVAAQVRAAGANVKLNTGPNMQPAR